MTSEQPGFQPDAFAYRAFFSYSHADRADVDRMFRRLAAFRTPGPLLRAIGEYGKPPRSLRLFLDRKSAQLGAVIPDRLQRAISGSAFLIVFCSRAAQRSEWVNREVEAFLASAPPHRVLPVFLDRQPDEPLEALMPPALAALGERAPLGADMILDGGPAPVAHKLIGAMIGFSQDAVSREQEKADKQRRLIERTALTAIAGLSLASAGLGFLAAREAKKSETSLITALDSLDTTTPFVRSLLTDGRVTVANIEPTLVKLSGLFSNLNNQDLRNLPDIRYAYGQVLTSFATLQGAAGEAFQRADNAALALRHLSAFQDEPGPRAQELICDAALEAADALGVVGRYPEAMAAARTCDEIAEREVSYHDEGASGLAPLIARRTLAKSAEARLLASQGRFKEALSAHDAALGSELLGAFEARDRSEERADARALGADLALARAATLEAMGRYEEATQVFQETLAVQETLGFSPVRMAGVQRGVIRMQGIVGDDYAGALARIDALGAALSAEVARDPSLRGLRAFLAELELDRALVHARRPPNAVIAGVGYPAVEADAAFRRAGAMYAELLSFDAQNPQWRRGEAWRLFALGDFYFRLFEQRGARAAICADHCLADSASALERARAMLQAEIVQPPGLLQLRADVSLRFARTARTSRDIPAARGYVEEAAALHRQFAAATDDERTAAMLQSRVADERADLMAATGAHADAAAAYREALAIYLRIVEEEPDWVTGRRDLIWTRFRLAESAQAAGDENGAREAFAAACADVGAAQNFRSRLLLRDAADVRQAAATAGAPCAAQ